MEKYNKTRRIAIVAMAILFLAACGGSGNKGNPSETPTIIELSKLKACEEGYSSLKREDKITALEDDTEVLIRHSEKGSREACVKSGEAKIN